MIFGSIWGLFKFGRGGGVVILGRTRLFFIGGRSLKVLKPGGAFLAKVLQGGTEAALLGELKRDFASVKHVKPPASRSDSAELYLLARGFRGGNQD